MSDLHEQLAAGDPEMLREILREAESYLGAQLTVALASNQRAMTFVSLMGAATTVIGSAAGSLLLGTQRPLGLVCALMAAGFLAAMAMALLAARPGGFWYVGNNPKYWAGDVERGESLAGALAGQCAHYSGMIDDNRLVLDRDSRRMMAALWIVMGVLIWGGVASAAVVALQIFGARFGA